MMMRSSCSACVISSVRCMTAIKSFPAMLYAPMAGFNEKPYFQAKPGAENVPKVQFDFGKPEPAGAAAK